MCVSVPESQVCFGPWLPWYMYATFLAHWHCALLSKNITNKRGCDVSTKAEAAHLLCYILFGLFAFGILIYFWIVLLELSSRWRVRELRVAWAFIGKVLVMVEYCGKFVTV